jgi:hypothetical protein
MKTASQDLVRQMQDSLSGQSILVEKFNVFFPAKGGQ